MSVTVTHPEYDARLKEWDRIHAVLAGRDAVIDKGEDFVPMLGGQNPSQYQAYLLRGLWFGATQRTRKGIVGLVFSQAPQVEVADTIDPLMEDVTLTDVSFEEFAKEVFNETIAYNWGGILVDVPPLGDEPINPADARPYLTFYCARNVRWWTRERVGGSMETTAVILQEVLETPNTSDYGASYEDIFRVLKLEKITENNRTAYVYMQEIWRQETDPNNPLDQKKEWRLTQTIVPKFRGKTLDFIPFTFTTTEGVEPQIRKSELLDLVDMNLDHWRLSVDLRHGLHFTALPTPCASAVPDGLDLRIGSEVAWTSTDPNFESWYLEYSGEGIGSIQEAIERNEHLMSLLGSRLLETQKRASETAEAMVIRQAGEDSVVMSCARSVEKALEKALWQMAWWMNGRDNEVSVSLTRALNDLQLTTQDMIVILKAYQSGVLSEQAWIEALIRKQWVRGRSWEQEQSLPRITEKEAMLAAGQFPEMDRTTVTTGGGVTNDRQMQPSTTSSSTPKKPGRGKSTKGSMRTKR